MQFKKLAALTGSAIMAGFSLAAPALAAVTNVADIGGLAFGSSTGATFPTFVVGADAATSDVAAAINLAAYLAGNVYTSSTVSVSGAAAGADGATLRVELSNTTAFTRDYDLSGSADLSLLPSTRGGRTANFLKEGKITLSGTDYKFYEKITVGGSNSVSSSNWLLSRGSSDSTFANQYQSIGFQIPASSGTAEMNYSVIFDTPIPLGTNNFTGQSVKFLGQDYTVTSSSSSKIELSPTTGAQFIGAGKSATIGDFTVTVDAVASATSGSADVSLTVCRGSACGSSTFKSGDSKTISVGGVDVPVTVQNVIYGSGASVIAGTTAFKIEGGVDLAAPNTNWRGFITLSGNELKTFGIRYTKSRTSFSGTDSVLTDPTSGSALRLWNVGGGTFASTVAWDATTGQWAYQNTTSGYQPFVNTTIYGGPSADLTDRSLTLYVSNATEALSGQHALMGMLPNQAAVLYVVEPQLTESGFTNAWALEFDPTGTDPVFQNTSIVVGPSSTDHNFLNYQKFRAGTSATGTLAAANPTGALAIAQGSASTTYSQRTVFVDDYGSKIVSASRDTVIIDIPTTQNYWDIIVGRESGSSTTVGSGVSKNPIQITFDVATLDTEISDPAKMSSDAIVVGGPAVNRLAAQLLGKTYPSKGAASGIPTDAALVQVFQNAFGSGKVAILVAGYNAAQTELAVSAITGGKVTAAKTSVTISGSVSAPVVA